MLSMYSINIFIGKPTALGHSQCFCDLKVTTHPWQSVLNKTTTYSILSLYNTLTLYPSGSKIRAEETLPHIVHHPSDVVVKIGSPATLSCRADGSPKPTIEWLRNGQPLENTKAEGQMPPMVLSEGSLFFLSVGGGRRGQSHEGVYTCVARNNAGSATSRNASLYIAGKIGSPGSVLKCYIYKQELSS